MKCDECQWDYPFHMLNPLYTNIGGVTSKAVCGICALKLMNMIHRSDRKKFDGYGAERMRQKAISWRERNPDSKPEPTESDNDTPRS